MNAEILLELITFSSIRMCLLGFSVEKKIIFFYCRVEIWKHVDLDAKTMHGSEGKSTLRSIALNRHS